MGKLILGVILTLVVLILGGLGMAMLGFIPTNANAEPPRMERRIANTAVDASMERHAPHVTNPVPPNDQNYIDGMKLYTMNCALCHGGLDRKPDSLSKSFYPPAPNLVSDPPDDPEWHIFYTIRTGVRYTGMPAWDKTLSEQDMWKITSLLSHFDKLPPAVQDYYQKTFGVFPQPETKEPLKKVDHD
ncbi:MAG TPA: cytochrome c, partial [Candidatus Sulfotelmatobacter sp.]|jgi:mono/diheme cytochrome c family protein|nr:cytochrome c [Candidatus Sulfotelmatobacter sp.]